VRLRGYFNRRFEPPAPFMRLFLELKDLNVKGFVNFLIDTGASTTTLLDKDVELLGLDIGNLRRSERKMEELAGSSTPT